MTLNRWIFARIITIFIKSSLDILNKSFFFSFFCFSDNAFITLLCCMIFCINMHDMLFLLGRQNQRVWLPFGTECITKVSLQVSQNTQLSPFSQFFSYFPYFFCLAGWEVHHNHHICITRVKLRWICYSANGFYAAKSQHQKRYVYIYYEIYFVT